MNLALVLVGFSIIIFVHELGHFIAARWAGIRVLAFALGFGPALVSYRQGLGLRIGGSERDYLAALERGDGAALSPTEYRFNLLPFGGYVKMLGQEDLDPGATSPEPDSYQNRPVWKRMIVISAGVIMNLLIGAALYVAVFMTGLETEPPWVGGVIPESPASRVRPINAEALGIEEPGLVPGDRIVRVNGRKPNSFNDLVLASAISDRGDHVALTVSRPGMAEPLEFSVAPEMNVITRFRGIGVEPARSAELFDPDSADERALFLERLEQLGWTGVEPGMRLVEVEGLAEVEGATALARAIQRSEGRPVRATFRAAAGPSTSVTLEPRVELQADLVRFDEEAAGYLQVEHLLGLTPVMMVGGVNERGRAEGLERGDVFARLGAIDFPSIPEGIAEIRRHAGRSIDLVLLRRAAPDETVAAAGIELGETATHPSEPRGLEGYRRIEMTADVSEDGRIGFTSDHTALDLGLLARPPQEIRSVFGDEQTRAPAARSIVARSGTMLLAVEGEPVSSLAEAREALRRTTAAAFRDDAGSTDVALTLAPPGEPPTRVTWRLHGDDLDRLHALGWAAEVDMRLFRPGVIEVRGDGPIEALAMGVRETHRVILMTYVTFARLFQGTVKIEHLKGPIGIAHLGTQAAERGVTWLLFFMALISINLAVVNFLPLPIVDGGQFLFLAVEAVRGRPVSIAFQQAVTVAGLVLIAAVFLLVTYNDILGLFAG